MHFIFQILVYGVSYYIVKVKYIHLTLIYLYNLIKKDENRTNMQMKFSEIGMNL